MSWGIWKYSNGMIFNYEVPKPMDSLVREKCHSVEWKFRSFGSYIPSVHPPSTPPSHKHINSLHDRISHDHECKESPNFANQSVP